MLPGTLPVAAICNFLDQTKWGGMWGHGQLRLGGGWGTSGGGQAEMLDAEMDRWDGAWGHGHVCRHCTQRAAALLWPHRLLLPLPFPGTRAPSLLWLRGCPAPAPSPTPWAGKPQRAQHAVVALALALAWGASRRCMQCAPIPDVMNCTLPLPLQSTATNACACPCTSPRVRACTP